MIANFLASDFPASGGRKLLIESGLFRPTAAVQPVEEES